MSNFQEKVINKSTQLICGLPKESFDSCCIRYNEELYTEVFVCSIDKSVDEENIFWLNGSTGFSRPTAYVLVAELGATIVLTKIEEKTQRGYHITSSAGTGDSSRMVQHTEKKYFRIVQQFGYAKIGNRRIPFSYELSEEMI